MDKTFLLSTEFLFATVLYNVQCFGSVFAFMILSMASNLFGFILQLEIFISILFRLLRLFRYYFFIISLASCLFPVVLVASGGEVRADGEGRTERMTETKTFIGFKNSLGRKRIKRWWGGGRTEGRVET